MTCPICGKTPRAEYRPFCSARCADLGRWLRDGYAIPSEDPEDVETALDAAEEAAEASVRKTH